MPWTRWRRASADPDFARARELKRPRACREAGQISEFGAFLVNECSPLRRRIVADMQRSAGAAREIRALIEGSVRQVDTGNDQVRAAREAMDEIAASVRRVSAMMGEILQASQDQAGGIAQVNGAVDRMDQVTESNAALVEQAAAAAASLQEQAQRLNASVSVFKLGGRPGRPHLQ